MTGAIIEAHDLVKRFGPSPALDGASFAAAAGEMIAVMGPSGSGKSTLLHCLAGVLVPDAGRVFFDGRRLDNLAAGDRAAIRRSSLGFVFQFGQLVPELPARENVMLPLVLGGMSRRAARAEADAWLDRVGVPELGDRLPGELSGGQGQRVAVARALVHRPVVVFADEPTGALDSLAGEAVMELLTESAREHGAALVIVTHEPRVAAYADREVFVRDGATTVAGLVGVIQLGLRLAVGRGGGRIRLVLMTLGIAAGTAGFLGVLGYQHARSEMAHRVQVRNVETDLQSVEPGALLWNVAYVSDPARPPFSGGYTLIRTAPGDGGLLPLGAPAAPQPGTAYVSPAVARLLRADDLEGDRWRALVPWRVVGTLDRAALSGPGERVVVAGADAAQLAAGPGARRIDDWATVSAAIPPPGIGPTELIAFAVIAAIALAPIVIFVASVARVGQRRRDERAAALRLLGAGSRQLAVLAAAEAGLAGALGAILGVLAVEALAIAPVIEFWSVSVFTADLLPSAGHIVLALVLVPLLAVGTAWVSLVRALAQPLQTRRRADRRVPGAWRLAPVAAGWAAMAYLLRSAPTGSTTAAVAIGLAVAVMIVGIVLSGGYVLHHVARLVRRVPGAAANIAGRRLEADAVGGFRAISGMAVAFAVVTAGLVVGASLRVPDTFAAPGLQAFGPRADAWVSLPPGGDAAARVTAAATATPGVVAAAAVRVGPGSAVGQTIGADCEQLATVLGGAVRCPAQPGALVPAAAGPVGGTIAVDGLGDGGNVVEAIDVPIAGHLPDGLSIAGIAPVVLVPPDIADRSGLDAGSSLLLSTDHDPLTLARVAGNVARDTVTDVAVSSPDRPVPAGSSTVQRVQRILTGISLLALVVAAIGLAIGAIDALVARRRTLAHLAATGVSGRTLRAATAIELAVPMLTAVCLAFVLGVGIGATFFRLYYGAGDIVVPWGRAGLLLALAFGAIAAVAAVTLPVVARVSRPDQLRTE